ncbi:hypothetical protein M432DRAFT_176235 [Thermoascus aurantiacus ATCC 26904]
MMKKPVVSGCPAHRWRSHTLWGAPRCGRAETLLFSSEGQRTRTILRAFASYPSRRPSMTYYARPRPTISNNNSRRPGCPVDPLFHHPVLWNAPSCAWLGQIVTATTMMAVLEAGVGITTGPRSGWAIDRVISCSMQGVPDSGVTLIPARRCHRIPDRPLDRGSRSWNVSRFFFFHSWLAIVLMRSEKNRPEMVGHSCCKWSRPTHARGCSRCLLVPKEGRDIDNTIMI